MTAEEESLAREIEEDKHAELLLLLLLDDAKKISSDIANGNAYDVDQAGLYVALLAAGVAGFNVIKRNSVSSSQTITDIFNTGYIERQAIKTAKQMKKTRLDEINQLRLTSIQETQDISDKELSRIVNASLERLAKNGSRLSASNMIVFAAEATKSLLIKSKGTKKWRTMRDSRVRQTHNAADRQVVSADDKFEVGSDFLMYPRDPSGSSIEIMGCRCVCEYSEAW
jgi:hypothetical protein